MAGSSNGLLPMLFRISLRSLQLVMALVVLGLYGTDLNESRKNNQPGNVKWMYAETIAGMTCITTFIYMLPFVRSHKVFAWDALLFIFWIAVFGTFATIYLHADPNGDGGVQRMKNAVWVDLFNVGLWFISTIFGAFMFFRDRGAPGSAAASKSEV